MDKNFNPPTPATPGRERPPLHSYRDIADAIFYVLPTGCAGRFLPHDYAPWQTVYGLLPPLENSQACGKRITMGSSNGCGSPQATPSVGILDSQSVRGANQAGARGYDAGKKVTGCPWHWAAHRGDDQGNLGAGSGWGARFVVVASSPCESAAVDWGEGGYVGAWLEGVWRMRPWRRVKWEIVKRVEEQRGFAVLPKGWIVERNVGLVG